MSGMDRAAGRFEQVIDPDVDLDDSYPRSESRPWRWDVLLAIAIGGILGAEARYGLDSALPHAGDAFPWSTVVVNVSGCLLIGALMVLLLELTYPHRLARPFLGVGLLGGYTTYSTFAVDVQRLVLDHRPLVALSYLGVTVLGCAAAVWLSTTLTLAVGRAILARRAPVRSDRARSDR
jgi:fluoride exporter